MKPYSILTNNKTSIRRPLLIILAVFAIAGAIITVLELTNRTFIFHDKPATTSDTVADSVKGEPDKNEDPQSKPSENNSTKGLGTSHSNTTLQAPYGDFVSNHHVYKNSVLSSVCTTSVGAMCQLIFTKGNITKTLEVAATDLDGNVYWNWKPSDIDLISGTWKITAKATLGTQTKTTDDVLLLEVN